MVSSSLRRIVVEIADQQSILSVDRRRLRRAVHSVLAEGGIAEARVSLAVVDDATIHTLNRQFLGHDYPTDVLSFLLDRSGARLEGEVIVSAQTAQTAASAFGWSPTDELLLYAIHGTLHLVGHNDHSASQRLRMRAEEDRHLARFGLKPPRNSATVPAAPRGGRSRASSAKVSVPRPRPGRRQQ